MGMNSGHREHQGFFVRKGNLNSDARHSTESDTLLPDSNSYCGYCGIAKSQPTYSEPVGFSRKKMLRGGLQLSTSANQSWTYLVVAELGNL